MKLTPRGDRLLVRPEEAEKQSETLIIPDSALAPPRKGLVLAAGREASLAPGTRVLYGVFSGQEVQLGGEGLLLMREKDILGVL